MQSASGRGKSKKDRVKESEAGLFESYESIINLEAIMFTEKIEYVKAGFTKGQLSRLKEILELDWITLSQLLMITDRTLHLKKEDDLLGLNACDRMMAVSEVYSQGYNLFRDKRLFHEWMQRENAAFGGSTPIQMMGTITGMDEVKNEILRLKYGGY